jgi:Methyltransferase domain
MIEMTRELQRRFAWWMTRGAGMIFDALHGSDTGSSVSGKPLNIASANLGKGLAYDPGPWPALRQTLGLASLRADGFTFVDVGCGKGKVLLSAMTMPFQRIVGVEYSAHLSRIAEENIAAARFLRRRCCSVDIICLDAVHYVFPEDPLMVFFANPFIYEIMEIVLKNIATSFQSRPRSIFLLFYRTSTIMPQISEFLATETGEAARWLISDTLARRSINIFELPG